MIKTIIISSILLICILVITIDNYIRKIKDKAARNSRNCTYNEISDRLMMSADWLNSDERKVYQDLIKYMAIRLKKYQYIDSKELREAIDEIINYKTKQNELK